jgi:phosphotransferase system HPr-like phosphotransfer protein
MKNFSIQLLSIADVKRFVDISSVQPFDIDIVSGRYIIDAKSILGIYSLDLTKPITVEVHGTEEDGRLLFELLKEFVK